MPGQPNERMAASIRPIRRDDYAQWRPLWDGYNAFYGRSGPTALDERITAQTWARFFETAGPMRAHVAEIDGVVVGIVHSLVHPSTSRLADVCYLADLYTDEAHRGRGIARALIQVVVDDARAAGLSRVYWTTHTSNETARLLYDRMADHRGFIVYAREL